MPPARLTLLTKPGCHLCDTARDVVAGVLEGLPTAASVTLEELSILDDPELTEKYWDEIPVLLLDGNVHNIWKIDAKRLTQSLLEATA